LQQTVRVSGKRVTIYAAIAANLAIATTKFIAAAATHSGALFSEGLHSLVDTGDGLLLLLGLHLSHRPATPRHPYGHGLEVYFWSMVVAMAIFGMGGGLSIYQGIHHILEPHALAITMWSYGVLAFAFVFEAISWVIAMRGFGRARGRRSIWQAIRRSKDPTTFIVVLEDSAALIGVMIAAVGITVAHVFAAPIADSIASILIGLLLCAVATILGRETWSLLTGEAASPDVVRSIRDIAKEHGGVDASEPRTMHFGPDLVHVDLDVHIDPSISGRELLDRAQRIETAVRERHPSVRRVSFRFAELSSR